MWTKLDNGATNPMSKAEFGNLMEVTKFILLYQQYISFVHISYLITHESGNADLFIPLSFMSQGTKILELICLRQILTPMLISDEYHGRADSTQVTNHNLNFVGGFENPYDPRN